MDITKSRAGFYLTNDNLNYLKQASKELGISRSYYISSEINVEVGNLESVGTIILKLE